MLKKLLIITPLALIAVTAAALAYVSFANLAPLALKLARSNYNIDIQAENPVLHLFPGLSFTASNVTIPNLNGEDGALLTAKHMDASIGWSAFPRFWAAPQLKGITLSDATLTLTQGKEGAPNWQLLTPNAQQNQQEEAKEVADADKQPAAFSLPTFGTISLTNVTVLYNNIQTNQKAEVKNLNLNLNGEDLTRLQADLSATLNGRPLRGNLTSDAKDLKEIQTQGQISFGSTQAAITGTVTNQSAFAGQISVQTDNVKQSIAEVLTTAPATVPAQPLRLTTYLKANESSYEVNNLSLSMGDLLRLTGSLAGDTAPVIAKGKVNIKTNNLRAMVAALTGQAQPSLPASAFAASTDLDYSASRTKLSSLSAQLAEALIANGTITYEPAGTTTAELKLQGNNLRALGQILPQLKGQSLPASAFTASAVADYEGQNLNIPSLEIAVPSALNLSAELAMVLTEVPNIKGNINVAKADLAALGYCEAAAPQSVASADSGNAPSAAASSPWSDEPLALDALQSFTGELDINASNLNCPTRPITAASIKLANTAEVLTLSSLSASFAPAGKVTGSGSVGHAGGTLKPNLTLQLSDYPADTLLPEASWSEGLKLPLNAEASLQAVGKTTRQLAQTLSGSLKANARAGKLPYSKTLTTLLNIDAMLGGDDIPARGSTEEINDLTADYSITNGIANAQKLAFTAADERVSMSGTGTINLPAWSISHTLLANAGSQKNIPVTINGNLSAPKVDLENAFRQRIQDRLLNEGGKSINKLLGGTDAGSKTEAITGAVGNLLGGKGLGGDEGVKNLLGAFGKKQQPVAQTPSPTEGESETAPTTQTNQPAEQLNNLLNNFLGQ